MSTADNVKVVLKEKPKPGYIVNFLPLRPLRVVEIQSCSAGSNDAREQAVRENIFVGEICFGVEEHDLRVTHIFHCPSGTILASWYADYLLFLPADDVERVVIAKPSN